MIRLSEAFARLHFDMEVKEDYVREAYRLISTSVMKLEKSPIEIMVEEFDQMIIDNKAVEVMVNIQ